MAVLIYQAIQPDGSALWPEERPIEWLLDKRSKMPAVMFNSQYQNDPSGLRGVRYAPEKLQFYTPLQLPPTHRLRVIQCCDLATSTESHADFFALVTGAKDIETGRVFILDIQFDRLGPDEHMEHIRNHFNSWRVRSMTPTKVQLEARGPQQGTTAHLLSEMRLDSRGPIPMEEVRPTGSKEFRFDAAIPYLTNGTVLFLGMNTPSGTVMSEHTGFAEFQRQFSRFPQGRDDVFDAVVMIIEEFCSTEEASAGYTPDSLPSTPDDEVESDTYYLEALRRRKELADRYDKRTSEPEYSAKEAVLSRSSRKPMFH